MIWTFKHRSLKRLYERGDRSGICPDLLGRVEDILSRLDVAMLPKALDLPGYHRFAGDMVRDSAGELSFLSTLPRDDNSNLTGLIDNSAEAHPAT